MGNIIIGAILGAVAALLVVGNNPALGRFFYKISNKVEEIIEKKLDKDI